MRARPHTKSISVGRPHARAARIAVVPVRARGGRRLDELRRHRRHQHGAALPLRRPRPRPSGERLPRRSDRRLPQPRSSARWCCTASSRRDGSRYVFKGDNNNFTDFEHPTRSQLIGALWIHLPGAGRALNSIRSPALIGLLFVIGTLLVGGVSFAKRRRRRKRGRAEGTAMPVASTAPAAKRAAFSEGRLGGVPAAAMVAFALAAMTPFFVAGRARLHPARRRGERDQRPLPADREAQLLGKPARRAHLPVREGAHRRTAVHARGPLRAARSSPMTSPPLPRTVSTRAAG